MVPKIIHYCWFGGKELPELAQKCIASWKKYCPDYEIKEWNEQNFDFNACDYVKEAYQNSKWAFVSDYARFQILYNHGGVYFDTDVELIASIQDIIDCGGFMGMEDDKCGVNSGLGMASEKGSAFLKEVIDAYHTRHFDLGNGVLDQTDVVVFVTQLLKRHGYTPEPVKQNIEGINIYPRDYFCPIDYGTGKLTITDNTRSIHHYTESWKSDKDLKWKAFERNIVNRIGRNKAEAVFHSPIVRLIGSLYRNGIAKTIRMLKMKRSNSVVD